MTNHNHPLFLLVLLTVAALVPIRAQLVEEERLEEYRKRNYTWPLPEVVPNTPGWNRLVRPRLAQVERSLENEGRYEGYIAIMTAALVAPTFTEYGWGLTRAPEALVQELKDSLHAGLETAPEERYTSSIKGPLRPLFVPQPLLNLKVLQGLKPMHEQWANVSLVGEAAYGLRIYRNQSSLYMHVDRLRTHVISSILHVDHSPDSEPWPIFIEDFAGNTNEVVLESGDILFYESSKCIHGRPRPFNGSWYSSIFTHYYPEGWDQDGHELETHYAIPPHWDVAQVPLEGEQVYPRLKMVDTTMTEPDCPDGWCNTRDTVKWRGPAPADRILSAADQEEFALTGGFGDEL